MSSSPPPAKSAKRTAADANASDEPETHAKREFPKREFDEVVYDDEYLNTPGNRTLWCIIRNDDVPEPFAARRVDASDKSKMFYILAPSEGPDSELNLHPDSVIRGETMLGDELIDHLGEDDEYPAIYERLAAMTAGESQDRVLGGTYTVINAGKLSIAEAETVIQGLRLCGITFYDVSDLNGFVNMLYRLAGLHPDDEDYPRFDLEDSPDYCDEYEYEKFDAQVEKEKIAESRKRIDARNAKLADKIAPVLDVLSLFSPFDRCVAQLDADDEPVKRPYNILQVLQLLAVDERLLPKSTGN